MKAKLFTKARIIIATLVLLSVGLVTGISATTGPSSGCPEGTGGYKYNGNRTKETCYQYKTEKGYWWYIKGEVKWVGTVFASMGGEYRADEQITTYKGQEYKCDGANYEVCWVCNCYYQQVVPIEN